MEAQVSFYEDRPLELSQIAETFKESFAREFDEGYWRWRFEDNPCQEKIYISYIIEQGCLASYYAVSPLTVSLPGEGDFKVALSNMTMTHPAFTGRGYFRTLALSLYERLAEDGFLGVLGLRMRILTMPFASIWVGRTYLV